MEHFNTLQKKESQPTDRSRWRLWCMMLLGILMGTASSIGQTITWQTYPDLSENNLTGYGKDITLSFKFQPSSDISDAKLKLTLPANVTCHQIDMGAGGTIAASKFTNNGSGLISCSDVVTSSDIVSLVITLRPQGVTAGTGTVGVEVLSGSTSLATQSIGVTLIKPALSIDAVTPTITYSDTDWENKVKHGFTLDAMTTEGTVTSFSVAFEVEYFSNLSGFKWGVHDLTPTESQVDPSDSKSNKVYTLSVQSSHLAGGELGSSAQQLTFDAYSDFRGKRPIKVSWKYPETPTYSSGEARQTFYMGYNQIAGTPNIELKEQYYTNASGMKLTASTWYNLTLDNYSLNHSHHIMLNKGTAAKGLVFSIYNPSPFSFAEKDELRYIIKDESGVQLESGKPANVIVYVTRTSGETTLNYTEETPSHLRVELAEGSIIPRNGTIEFIVPQRIGMIYDNKGSDKDYYIRSNPYLYFLYPPRVLYAVTEGGETQTSSASSPTSYTGLVPRMQSSVAPLYIKPDQENGVNIYIVPYSISSGLNEQEVFIRVPKWLTLQNTTVDYIQGDGTIWKGGIPVSIPTPDGEYNIYSWKLDQSGNSSENDLIALKFKGPSATDYPNTHPNVEGNITYWINQKINNTYTLEAVTQRQQKVTLLCKEDGIVLEKFYSIRSDKGYIDLDRNGYPDNLNKVTDPRGDLFLPTDKGALVWEATVTASGATMDRLYLPLETSLANLLHGTGGYFIVDKSNISVSIQRGAGVPQTQTMTYNEVSGSTTQRYLSLSGFVFEAGDKLTITMPFTSTQSATLKWGEITTGCKVHNNDISPAELFNDASTVGKGFDKESVTLWSVNWWATGIYTFATTPHKFSNEIASTLNEFALAAPLYDKLHAPGGFQQNQESRTDKMPYLESFSLDLPDGYELESVTIYVSRAMILGNATSAPSVIIPVEDATITGRNYFFDLSSIWVDTEASYVSGTNIVKTGVSSNIYVRPRVKASKNASSRPISVPVTFNFANTAAGHRGSATTNVIQFQYTGITSELTTTTSEIYASTEARDLTLAVSNPNTIKMENNHLYVEGAVSSLTLRPTGNTTGTTLSPINSGSNYAWFALPDIEAGKSLDYILTFNYTGPKSGGELKLYTASKLNNSSWESSIVTGALNPALPAVQPYIGGSKIIPVLSSTSTVAGGITVDNRTLALNSLHTVTASLNSRSSQAEVKNPTMEITIPKGFKYQPGTAKVYWNNSTGVAVSSTVETALQNATLNTASPTPFAFSAKEALGLSSDFILPVSGGAAMQEVSLVADFKVDCETVLYNVQFKGEISAQDTYNDPALGSGREYSTNTMAANIPNLKSFNISTSVTNDVFTPSQTESTLSIEVSRYQNLGTLATEKLIITLPKELNIKSGGSITASGDIAGITVSTPANDDDGTTRTIAITLDHAKMNAAALNQKVIYSVPLESTFTGAEAALLANPGKLIKATVTTDRSLDSSCPNASPFPVSEEKDTDILFLAYTVPSPNVASLGSLYKVTTTSAGVEGTISIGSDAGTFDGTDTWSVTPSTAISGDDEPRTVTITPTYGGVTFSPVTTSITVYPSLIFSAATDATICGTGTDSQDLSQLVSGDAVATGISTKMKYYEGNSTTPLGNTTVSPTIATDYYVQSETHDGVIQGEKKKITINVTAPAVITSDLSTTAVYKSIGEASYPLSITATGDGLSYQWYSSNLDDSGQTPIPGEITASYSVPTTSASSKKYYVKVTGCNGEVTSLKAVVHVVAGPAAVTFGNAPYEYCDVVPVGLNLWDEINREAGNTYWYSSTSGGSFTEVTASHTVVINSAVTYYVKSKNAAGAYSAEAVFTVVVNAPAVITGDLSATAVYKTVGEASHPLSITATGDGLTYQWYTSDVDDNNETPIMGATTTSYNVETTVASSKKYYVKITSCAGVIESEKAVVHIVDAPSAVTFKSAPYTYCVLPAGLNLWAEIHTVGGLTYWYATSPGGSLTEVSASNPVSIGSAGSYYVKSRNAAGVYSSEAELQVVVHPPITLAVPTAPLNGEQGQSITLTATVTTGSATSFELYRSGESIPDDTNTSGSFTFTLSLPADNGQAYEAVNYYIKAIGAIPCADGTSGNIEVRIYPAPVFTPAAPYENGFCITDSRLGATGSGINLWDYIQDKNTNWFTYTYGINEEATTEIPADGLVKPDAVRSSYTLKIKAVNKLSPSSLTPCEVPYTLAVFKNTSISNLTGYEVTEGEPVQIVVTADGEPTLTYLWQKWDGSNWQPLTSLSGNSVTLTPSANITENGARYRVVVTSLGSMTGCDTDTREFKLNVKSAVTPPLGNYRVSWTVIGYGKVEVTADGISISNGSHVNKGTKLQIYATTWLSNVLDKVTVNGTEYKSSPITYTVGEENVNIVAEFNGSDPNPDPNSNADIESSTRIWTEGGYACIYTETATRARIITFNGRLVTDQKVGEGESRIQLPDGYYIVTLSDGTTKKIAIRNF